MLVRPLLASLLTSLVMFGLAAPTQAASALTSTAAPRVQGAVVVGNLLKAGRGSWEPAEVTVSFQWLRDAAPIVGATTRFYRVELADLRHRLSVRVSATDQAGDTADATSKATRLVARGRLRNKAKPAVEGTSRFTQTVTADPGRWSHSPQRTNFQWLRGNRLIAGATRARYTFAPEDVGRRVRVRITVKVPGYHPATAISPRGDQVGHRIDVRRTVTYRIETRGQITTSVKKFARLAQETYDDPRGWRGAGIRFEQVARGGNFTLVLASASSVPGFSSGCSSMWSCRVGRNVIINQERWKYASPAWNAAKGSRRNYRHMVVNHETGHWLGLDHSGCPGPGRAAPVMMQQSKGLNGCHFNPWPTGGEQRSRTPR